MTNETDTGTNTNTETNTDTDNPGFYPFCFESPAQYARWEQVSRRAPPGASSYCTDCTPEYQLKMIRQARCAYPRTIFIRTKDGERVGRRPASEQIKCEPKEA